MKKIVVNPKWAGERENARTTEKNTGPVFGVLE